MSNLVVKTISTERLMVSRLYSNKRHEDFEASVNNKEIDKERFEKVFEEINSIAFELSKKDFKENAYMVKDLYQKKGWDYENSVAKDLCQQ